MAMTRGDVSPPSPLSVTRRLADPTAAQLALRLGWTIAVLYGDIPSVSLNGIRRLPTVYELPDDERRELERGRLQYLLETLNAHPDCRSAHLPTQTNILPDVEDEDFRRSLQHLNLEILKALAHASPEIELAYELGRSIRDTVNPPSNGSNPNSGELASQLERSRIAKLQDWLATLSTQYPPHAASIVSASLGRWSELAEVTIGESKSYLKGKNKRAAFEQNMKEYLLPQGDLWLTLLVGTLSTSGLLSPEGYVAAGQEALRRSAIIVREVIKRYRVPLAVIALLTAGILFLAYINLEGAAKVWTYIVTIAGAIGVSTKSVMSSLGRLSAQAERPIFSVAQEDAMAWAVTTMPEVDLKRSGARQLRHAGVTQQGDISRP
jgi:hypothetical protein